MKIRKMSERMYVVGGTIMVVVLATIEVLIANAAFAFGVASGLAFSLIMSYVGRNYVTKTPKSDSKGSE